MSPSAATKVAKAIAIEAAKGTVFGLTVAVGYKLAISDPMERSINDYYVKHPVGVSSGPDEFTKALIQKKMESN
eukprot:CAMPEP_0181335390 /NCGR_PEP_ID=MMETSP1101-20121128/26804_1 /TAXON_ID=46948 /ORGANISM="Rhodomonas abbreviata, Strain Caron Lab Isolate" /LENGTH=73 /DNA_ID=CAMNT_0023445503 /DNA_START=58 /DNA_END=279 /DNA_ORIENTATION=+